MFPFIHFLFFYRSFIKHRYISMFDFLFYTIINQYINNNLVKIFKSSLIYKYCIQLFIYVKVFEHTIILKFSQASCTQPCLYSYKSLRFLRNLRYLRNEQKEGTRSWGIKLVLFYLLMICFDLRKHTRCKPTVINFKKRSNCCYSSAFNIRRNTDHPTCNRYNEYFNTKSLLWREITQQPYGRYGAFGL